MKIYDELNKTDISNNRKKKILKVLRESTSPRCTWAIQNNEKKVKQYERHKIRRKVMMNLCRHRYFRKEDWEIIKRENLNPHEYMRTKEGLQKKTPEIIEKERKAWIFAKKKACRKIRANDEHLGSSRKKKKTMPNINRKAPPLLINDKPIEIKIEKQLKNKFDRNFEDKNKSFKLD